MKLIACGLNHETAPLVLREKLAHSMGNHQHFLPTLMQSIGCTEAVFLNTCNRYELYGFMPDLSSLINYLSSLHNLSADEFKKHVYIHEDVAAIAHAMRVAAGMDSMVFGEPQIFGQVKAAVAMAREMGVLGSSLQHIFEHVFLTVKKIRTETAIGQENLTIASVAVNLAKMIFEDFAQVRVLLIGAGDIIAQVIKNFSNYGVKHFKIVNRSLAHASALLAPYQGTAHAFDALESLIGVSDVIVSATSAPDYILTKQQVVNASKEKRYRPQYFIDLAVPRDIEPSVADLNHIYLYNVDDLQKIIHTNLDKRKAAILQANEIIQKELKSCLQKRRMKENHHVIEAYCENARMIKEKEIAVAIALLKSGMSPEKVIHRLGHALTGKLTHEPILMIKELLSKL